MVGRRNDLPSPPKKNRFRSRSTNHRFTDGNGQLSSPWRRGVGLPVVAVSLGDGVLQRFEDSPKHLIVVEAKGHKPERSRFGTDGGRTRWLLLLFVVYYL